RTFGEARRVVDAGDDDVERLGVAERAAAAVALVVDRDGDRGRAREVGGGCVDEATGQRGVDRRLVAEDRAGGGRRDRRREVREGERAVGRAVVEAHVRRAAVI